MRSQILLTPLAFASARAIAINSPRTSSNRVCDFEDPTLYPFPSDLGVDAKPIPQGYCGFQWSFAAAHRGLIQPLNMNGNGFAVASNTAASTLSTDYVGSTTKPFTPISAAIGCYEKDDTSVALAINCTVRVTPAANSPQTFTPAFKDCAFAPSGPANGTVLSTLSPAGLNTLFERFGIGEGTVQACGFPATWKNVAQLTFSLVVADLPDLSGVTDQLGVRVGEPNFAIDDVTVQDAV